MFKNDVNLNLYKVFYDVCKYGSFSKTAELTYMTQPSISKSIKKLESELDTKLFYRKPDGVELTDKGKELLYYVEKSFGSLLTAERIMLERDNLEHGLLSIGTTSNLYSIYLIPLIKEFKYKYPKIEISVITGNTSFLLNQLETHKIDFIIDTLPIINYGNDLTIKKLFELDYCFISNNKSNIKDIKELEKETLLLPIEGTSNRNNLDELFVENDMTLKSIINLHTSDMILSSTISGLGIGYILEKYVEKELSNNIIYKVNINNSLPKSEVAIVYNKKYLTNVPKYFINEFIK